MGTPAIFWLGETPEGVEAVLRKMSKIAQEGDVRLLRERTVFCYDLTTGKEIVASRASHPFELYVLGGTFPKDQSQKNGQCEGSSFLDFYFNRRDDGEFSLSLLGPEQRVVICSASREYVPVEFHAGLPFYLQTENIAWRNDTVPEGSEWFKAIRSRYTCVDAAHIEAWEHGTIRNLVRRRLVSLVNGKASQTMGQGNVYKAPAVPHIIGEYS